ncbi:uncharacterized protein LOC125672978 isoform X2 [Ostrea edulis]|uniref:uncharacterized protein LOC125672978 isoform X2 n=1 Tax=Ostrea edulis TaxID=37623 RepID=UPI0024AEA3A9|nr:uncharacterized protein LOC125672978 isoform X2 [Ostrea edulis]
MTGRQGMFIPPRHLILPLVYAKNCSLFVHDNISGRRRNAVLPGDCCYTSLCNHRKPDETSREALTCYSCTETDNPKNCVTTTQCLPDQLCVVTQALNANFKMVYRLGCMDRHQCDAFRHDGLGNRRSIVAMGDCCDHDRCNSYTPEEIGSPTFNSKDCKDVDANVCHGLRHSNHVDRCQDKEFANVFCPKTCNTCFKCYNCFVASAQNFNLCSKSNYSVCETKTQSCVTDLFNGITMMTCVNDTLCADDKINNDKKCCKHDFCNTLDSLTTTPSTVKTSPTTTEVTTPSTAKTSPTTTEVTTPSTVKTNPTTTEVTTPSTVKTNPTTVKVTTPSTVKTSPTTTEVTTPSTKKTSLTTGSTFGFITIPHQQPTTTAHIWATLGTPPHSTKWVTLPRSGHGQQPPSRK